MTRTEILSVLGNPAIIEASILQYTECVVNLDTYTIAMSKFFPDTWMALYKDQLIFNKDLNDLLQYLNDSNIPIHETALKYIDVPS